MSEPLYTIADSSVVRDNGASLLSKFPNAPQFPSSLDAVKDFDNAVLSIVEQIGAEYSRFASEDEKPTSKSANAGAGKAQAAQTMATTAPRGQVESAAERRRERFLTDFT